MEVFGAYISSNVSDFLKKNLKSVSSFKTANQNIYDSTGITNFFDSDEELTVLKEEIFITHNVLKEPGRQEYGDFQTNTELAKNATLYLLSKGISPTIIVEPTCGKGHFIIASLQYFPRIKVIFGIEIYKPYVWQTKFNVIKFFIENDKNNKPDISIIHCDVFDFDFKQVALQFNNENFLVIGNPPWVTNSKLGSLNSTNLPTKSNFKNHNGLDAMTGKGNFDIAEFITIAMLNTFHKINGNILLLVKNSVIKNILFDQFVNSYQISEIEKHCIDSKKEFNVSVEASLFYCKLNTSPALICNEFDFYKNNYIKVTFGWLNNKFVSNISEYVNTKQIDGLCPFVWRQGLKHDCSSVMELDKVDGNYINAFNNTVQLEEGLIFGILKSSDLKNTVINGTRKFTIVTQKKIGQETKYIKSEYPKTYDYLLNNLSSFQARKSIIYKNKPLFSIFGIGDYSFMPFKVAISGLYKTFHFTLILPQENKPVMLDDTCYFIGFDRIEFAVYALIILNLKESMSFLKSITFADAKRTFTKDVLMRIDMLNLAKWINEAILQTELTKLNIQYNLNLNLNYWDSFMNEMSPIKDKQIAMFI